MLGCPSIVLGLLFWRESGRAGRRFGLLPGRRLALLERLGSVAIFLEGLFEIGQPLVVTGVPRFADLRHQRSALLLELGLEHLGLELRKSAHGRFAFVQGRRQLGDLPVEGSHLVMQLPVLVANDRKDFFSPPNVLARIDPLFRRTLELFLRLPAHGSGLRFEIVAHASSVIRANTSRSLMKRYRFPSFGPRAT